jgi:hypothetical protein
LFELKNLNVHRIVESQDEVDKLKAQGFELVTDKALPDFSSMKIEELKAYAAGEKIDLTGLTQKNDISAKLKGGK